MSIWERRNQRHSETQSPKWGEINQEIEEVASIRFLKTENVSA